MSTTTSVSMKNKEKYQYFTADFFFIVACVNFISSLTLRMQGNFSYFFFLSSADIFQN